MVDKVFDKFEAGAPGHEAKDVREKPLPERGAMKRYIANTAVSIVVVMAPGVSRRVSFTPQTASGSVFYTDNIRLQKALERHYRFGSLFRIDPFFKPSRLIHPPHHPGHDRGEIKVEAGVAPVEYRPGKEPRRMSFSDYEAAKDYLCDHYGFLRTKLRSQKQIQEAAEQKNIELEIG